jgi:hypothetical protein
MTTRATLRESILELVPFDAFVPADDVVRSLGPYPHKAVWAQIVILSMDGVLTTEHCERRLCNGRAMLRRLA